MDPTIIDKSGPARCALTRRIGDERASGSSDAVRVEFGMEFWLKLNELAWRSIQCALEQQLIITGDCLDSATRYLKALSEAECLPELWMAHVQIYLISNQVLPNNHMHRR
jgi:hypothetical protein